MYDLLIVSNMQEILIHMPFYRLIAHCRVLFLDLMYMYVCMCASDGICWEEVGN